MACNFCSATPSISVCPICSPRDPNRTEVKLSKGRQNAPAVRLEVKAPSPVRTTQPAQTSAHKPNAPLSIEQVLLLAKVRDAYQAGQMNQACATFAQLLGGKDQVTRIYCLTLIDSNAEKRGYISEQDLRLRASLWNAMVQEYGCDPTHKRVEAPKVDPSKAVTIIDRPIPVIPNNWNGQGGVA